MKESFRKMSKISVKCKFVLWSSPSEVHYERVLVSRCDLVLATIIFLGGAFAVDTHDAFFLWYSALAPERTNSSFNMLHRASSQWACLHKWQVNHLRLVQYLLDVHVCLVDGTFITCLRSKECFVTWSAIHSYVDVSHVYHILHYVNWLVNWIRFVDLSIRRIIS